MITTIKYSTNVGGEHEEKEISQEAFEKAIFHLLTDVKSELKRYVQKSDDGTEFTVLKFTKKDDDGKYFKFGIIKENER